MDQTTDRGPETAETNARVVVCRRSRRATGASSYAVILFLGCILFFSRGAGEAAVRDLGIVGKVYPIEEKDMQEVLKARAAKINAESLKADLAGRARKAFYASFPLPKCTERLVRHIDPSIVLAEDIKDHRGKILAPKGTVVNPLDYTVLAKTYIVINGTDMKQVKMAKAYKDPKTVLLTEGDPVALGRTLESAVYSATTPVLQRFEIGHVPAVVRQEGRLIRVEEIPVD